MKTQSQWVVVLFNSGHFLEILLKRHPFLAVYERSVLLKVSNNTEITLSNHWESIHHVTQLFYIRLPYQLAAFL